MGRNFSNHIIFLISARSLVLTGFVMIDLYKYPRLYLNASFEENAKISLNLEHSHYLKNVLRKNEGAVLRVFNGQNGEWLALIDALGKKSGDIILTEQIKEQTNAPAPLNLFFSPIKKQRMDFLIEKAVELGVTGLYPVIMNRTENRKLNESRMNAQIIEAAEQCERLDLPILHPSQKLNDILGQDLFMCLERKAGAKPISSYSYKDGASFIIGPEGGFDTQETKLLLANEKITAINLGDNILRAETAAIACLSYARLMTL